MEITIGGNRLGSGDKNKQHLHDYERSTHNLSQKFTSSMQVGTLYPFMVIPAMRGDTFDINLEADCRTIPTKGPLFGSFKMQYDVFKCDVRLYQALLHNNPLAIGMNMSQVKFPLLEIKSIANKDTKENRYQWLKMNNSCLMKYLGLSGLGSLPSTELSGDKTLVRQINAIPALAYYEIFKTYYANKQEEYAYVYGGNRVYTDSEDVIDSFGLPDQQVNYDEMFNTDARSIKLYFVDETYKPFYDNWKKYTQVEFAYEDSNENLQTYYRGSVESAIERNYLWERKVNDVYYLNTDLFTYNNGTDIVPMQMMFVTGNWYQMNEYALQQFKLSNIDDMRMELLSKHTLGAPFKINNTSGDWNPSKGDNSGMPYSLLVGIDSSGKTLNQYPLNGLVVKTYQSDIFNNWVKTDWITGDNGIAAVTAISTSSGSFTIDSLNLAQKLYNMLNRVAVSDGSYESWLDAVYTDIPSAHIESPVYLGGMSSEIVFEEIVQSAPADGEPLGTLAGKGRIIKRKGGNIHVKCDQPAFIIGIVSLTPRINYSQGNEFYLTDLKTMNDYHKPALDQIGMQDLIAERMAWWDTKISSSGYAIARSSIGKIPSWLEYMTAVDKCYGDFADVEGYGFMSLLRNYEMSDTLQIEDATTYIDPRKYNYAFAYNGLDAQNFWVQINCDIKARRLMSAKQIPNI